MLNRRAFLKRFGIGVTAALALAALPESAIAGLTETDAGRHIAGEYLLREYRAYMSDKKLGESPTLMEVPHGLFKAFEGELPLAWRFTRTSHPDGLSFKNAALISAPDLGPQWQVRFTGPTR